MICLDDFELNTQLLLNHILDGVIVTDEQLNVVVYNAAAEKIFGYSPEEMLGHSVLNLTPENGRDDVKTMMSAQFNTLQEGHRQEILCVTKSGAEIITESLTSTLFTDTCSLMLAIIRDVTEQKNTHDKLTIEHANNRLLVNSIGSILIQIDSQNKIEIFNPIAEKTFNIRENDAIGNRLTKLKLNWDWDRVYKKMALKGIKHEITYIDALKFQKNDGSPGFLEIMIHPIYDENNNYKGLLFLGEDITEKQEMDLLATQAQKLESIGQLATGIAHEINTPIQYVAGNLEFLSESYKDTVQYIEKIETLSKDVAKKCNRPECLQEIIQLKEDLDIDYLLQEVPQAIAQSSLGIQKVATITAAMKTFSHPAVSEKIPVDINSTLDTAISISTNEWKYSASINRDFDETLPLAPAFPSELCNTFINLIVNAAHAIDEKFASNDAAPNNNNHIPGIIDISTSQSDKFIEISVSDNGSGVPEPIQKRIFDQFFTTKKVGKGTGQGLAISHATITHKHQGQISIKTSDTGGAKFTIKIPR